MKRFVFGVIILISIIGPSCVYADGGKYKDLFYPNGMPIKEGYFETGPTVYEFYDEAEISEANLLFVLYSESIKTTGIQENNEYTAYLAIINKTDSGLSVISKLDVTEYITVEMEITGGLAELAGVIDIFPLKNNVDALHLSIVGRLSGSGSDLSSSDVFFLINSENKSLTPILELIDTALFSRSGVAKSKYKYTSIYTIANEETGTQILTQDYNYELDMGKNIDLGVLSPDIKVYQYDFDNNKYSIANTITELPAGASLIERVVNLDTNCKSGCGED